MPAGLPDQDLVASRSFVYSRCSGVCAFNGTTGAVAWTRPDIVGDPVAAVGDYVVALTDYPARAWGLLATTGRTLWTYQVSGMSQFENSARVIDGALYVAGIDGRLYSLDLRTGRPRWTFDSGLGWLAGMLPSAANGLLYLTTTNGALDVLNEATGAQVAGYALDGLAGSSPVIVDGLLIVDTNNSLTALSESSCAMRCTAVWSQPGRFAGVAATGGHLFVTTPDGLIESLVAATGAVSWKGRFETGLAVVFGPVLAGDVAYLSYGQGSVVAFPQRCITPCSPLWFSQMANVGEQNVAPIVANGTLYEPTSFGLYAFRPAYMAPPMPPAPTGVTVAMQDCGAATVSWDNVAPGSLPITGYRVMPSQGPTQFVVGTPSGGTWTSGDVQLTDLPNGVPLTFTVSAENASGMGPGTTIGTFTEYCSPSSPILGAVTAGRASITVSWAPPASDGGKPITGFQVRCNDQSGSAGYVNASATARSATLAGLQAGHGYYCNVYAINVEGLGDPSDWSPWVYPR